MAPTSSLTRLSSCMRVFLVLAILFAASGCVSHVKELREAQNHFNTAAQLENQLKIDPLSGDALALNAQANASYYLSLKMLTALIDKNKQELRTDDLLGTAYTLKALAEWRIGKFDDALNTVNTIGSDKEIKLFPRDRVLVNALRGLIKNDQAYAHMVAKDYDYASIKSLLKSSFNDVKDNVAESDSHRLYLATVQMVILKNWTDLRGDPKAYSSTDPKIDKETEISEWCVYAKPAWQAFVNELNSLPEEKAGALKSFWGKRLAMPDTCP